LLLLWLYVKQLPYSRTVAHRWFVGAAFLFKLQKSLSNICFYHLSKVKSILIFQTYIAKNLTLKKCFKKFFKKVLIIFERRKTTVF